jgi:hypothetical protein
MRKESRYNNGREEENDGEEGKGGQNDRRGYPA